MTSPNAVTRDQSASSELGSERYKKQRSERSELGSERYKKQRSERSERESERYEGSRSKEPSAALGSSDPELA